MEYEDALTLSTPEGLTVRLPLAGVGSRLAAALVDVLIQFGILAAWAVVLWVLGYFGAALYSIVAFFLIFGYHSFFEVLASGRTPGKRKNGIRVIRTGGEPVGFLASAIRNLLRIVDFLPSFYLAGAIAIILSPKNQRLGDIAAGTIVVRDRPAPAPVAAGATVSWPEERPAWDTTTVTAEELAAVRQFLQRRWEIAPGARYEIARTMAERLRPKVGGVQEALDPERFLELLAAIRSSK